MFGLFLIYSAALLSFIEAVMDGLSGDKQLSALYAIVGILFLILGHLKEQK